MTDCIDVVNTENETELSWPIKLSTVFDENKVIDHIGLVYTKNDTK